MRRYSWLCFVVLSLSGCDALVGGGGLSITGGGASTDGGADGGDLAFVPGPNDLAVAVIMAPPDLAWTVEDAAPCAGPACNECVDKVLDSQLQGQAPPAMKSIGSLSPDAQQTPQVQLDKAVPFIHAHLTSGGAFAVKSLYYHPYVRVYRSPNGSPPPFFLDVHSTQHPTNHEWYAQMQLPPGTYEVVITSEDNATTCPQGAGSEGLCVIAFR